MYTKEKINMVNQSLKIASIGASAEVDQLVDYVKEALDEIVRLQKENRRLKIENDQIKGEYDR